MNVEQIALLLRVYALRKLQDFNLFSHLSARLIALAQASSPDADGDVHHAAAPLSSFRGVDLTNILVACGRLLFSDRRIADEEFFRLVARALPPYVYDLTPIALANVCTSFASVGLYEEKLFDAVTAEAERRITEFGGCELLSLLLGLSKMQAALPPHKKRRDGRCLSAILRALRGRMGPFGFVQNLQVLESLVLLGHYDSLFIHTKVLPALLARRPTPPGGPSALATPHGSAADAAAAATADSVLGLYLRVLCCLYRLPNLSQTGIQLLQEVAEQLPRCFQRTQIAGMAAALHLLHKLDCLDYDCFSKADAILLADRVATLRQLRFANILQLRDAFRALGDEEHWGEVLKFLDGVVHETETLLTEARGVDDAHERDDVAAVRGANKGGGSTALQRDSPRDQTYFHHEDHDERDSRTGCRLGAGAQESDRARKGEGGSEQDLHGREVASGGSDGTHNTRQFRGSTREATPDFAQVSDSESESHSQLESRAADARQSVPRREAVVHAHQYSPDGEYTSRPVTLDKHIRTKRVRATRRVHAPAEEVE
ncbi:conserved hypothetical protein [Neospora caninum Liverpool]|uniref:Uncharacterized protein n=1 Tax=Neospora caninum (strain Liverpool) TaxID=572307 RepID=F0VRK4_NEOCL|nr:conserved hypothetical protein [Neospora caninum Liverpool]CBZ56352.1 conserved hypothetical protein [Neospora caninum Liverpool]|eukprot:XP_003886377.1 conserved hypothetical protein [Neospora caninum Liverpool]